MTQDQTAGPTRGPRRAPAFGFIYASAVMNALSFGLMIPVLPNLIKALVGGTDAGRWGNAHANLVPYQLFHAADRPVVIAVGLIAGLAYLGLRRLRGAPTGLEEVPAA